MAEVQKARVISKSDNGEVRVQVLGGAEVSPLLKFENYELSVGDVVAVSIFNDGTGIIFSKM